MTERRAPSQGAHRGRGATHCHQHR